MTQEEFLDRLAELYEANIDISKRKNEDYADDNDAFKNFRTAEIYGISIGQGVLVRMGDKMMRVSNLLKRDARVADESILDTLSDLANYAMILRIILEEERKPKKDRQ